MNSIEDLDGRSVRRSKCYSSHVSVGWKKGFSFKSAIRKGVCCITQAIALFCQTKSPHEGHEFNPFREGDRVCRNGSLPETQLRTVSSAHPSRTESFVTEYLAPVPWGHHIEIMKKVKEPAARLWYLQATAQFGWSRNVLLNQIKAGAYERAVTEKKTHNFALASPDEMAEQADEMLKSTYSLDFLGLTKAVKERELEDRLITRLQAFLLELDIGWPRTHSLNNP